MRRRTVVVVLASAVAAFACGREADVGEWEARETPLPAQTPIGAEDVNPPAGPGTEQVVDTGEVPDTDRDGVPYVSDTVSVR